MSSIVESVDVAPQRHSAVRNAPRVAIVALSLAMLLSSLGTSVANVALPSLQQAFRASFQSIQWVVLAYLLALTTLVVGAGRLGDILGRRRLLLWGVALFTTASLAAGLAPTLPLLIAARALQGVGGAVMMTLTMSFVGDTVSRERAGSAMGLLGTMSAIGTALGPSLGGWLLAGPGWRVLFLTNVPLGLVALVLMGRALPTAMSPQSTAVKSFDVRGAVLLAATLASYALAMTTARGGLGWRNLALLAGASLGVLLFVRVESRAASPLVRLTLLSDRLLAAGLTANAIVTTVIMATFVVGPFYLARGLQLSPATVGVVMSVGPIVVALAGIPSGRLADRFGTHRTTVIGLAIALAGALLLAALPTSAALFAYTPSLALLTLGYAIFQTANNAAVVLRVPSETRGVVSGLLALSRNLGLVTGASLMGTLFSVASHSGAAPVESAAANAFGMRVTFAAGALLIALALSLMLREPARRHV